MGVVRVFGAILVDILVQSDRPRKIMILLIELGCFIGGSITLAWSYNSTLWD